MALGRLDLSLLTLPAGWDAAELEKARLADGTTYAEVASQLETALAALNAEIATDPVWSSLVSYDSEPTVEYRQGASNGFEQATEYGLPDVKRADTTGHMIPLNPFDRRLGWTFRYLRNARMSQLQAGVADAIVDARALFRQQVIRRLLKRGDDSIGSSGLSPGFATAAASTGVDYLPPAYGGTTFTTDHEHYVGIAGGAFTAAVFTDAASELEEHGHVPPFDFLIGPSDEAAVRALTGFVAAADPMIRYSSTTSVASMDAYYGVDGKKFIGTLSGFNVWVIRGMPQYYGVGYKSYGPNSARNPLRVRVRDGETAIRFEAIPDPAGGNANYPLQNILLMTEFGVGVGERTGATARYVNNTTWADGTAA